MDLIKFREQLDIFFNSENQNSLKEIEKSWSLIETILQDAYHNGNPRFVVEMFQTIEDKYLHKDYLKQSNHNINSSASFVKAKMTTLETMLNKLNKAYGTQYYFSFSLPKYIKRSPDKIRPDLRPQVIRLYNQSLDQNGTYDSKTLEPLLKAEFGEDSFGNALAFVDEILKEVNFEFNHKNKTGLPVKKISHVKLLLVCYLYYRSCFSADNWDTNFKDHNDKFIEAMVDLAAPKTIENFYWKDNIKIKFLDNQYLSEFNDILDKIKNHPDFRDINVLENAKTEIKKHVYPWLANFLGFNIIKKNDKQLEIKKRDHENILFVLENKLSLPDPILNKIIQQLNELINNPTDFLNFDQ